MKNFPRQNYVMLAITPPERPYWQALAVALGELGRRAVENVLADSLFVASYVAQVVKAYGVPLFWAATRRLPSHQACVRGIRKVLPFVFAGIWLLY